jgi:hypothetical protein
LLRLDVPPGHQGFTLMRRLASLLSLALVLLGIEMSTKMASLTFGRLMSGFSAVAGGLEFHVSTMRFLVGVILLAVGVLSTALFSWVDRAERRMTSRGDRCPQCRSEMHRAKRRPIHKVVSWLMGQELSRRQCKECDWSGLALKY